MTLSSIDTKTRARLRKLYLKVAADIALGKSEFICLGISYRSKSSRSFAALAKDAMGFFYRPKRHRPGDVEPWWPDPRKIAERRRNAHEGNRQQRILALLFMVAIMSTPCTLIDE